VSYMRLEARGHPLEERALPVEVEQVRWVGGSKPAAWSDGPRLLASLKQVVRQVRPEMVIAGPIQRSALLAALAGVRPLISMSWGYDLLVDAGRSPLWSRATRFTLKRSDVLIGDCQTIRQLAISHGMDPSRIITFPWGVDLGHFAPCRVPEKQGSSFTMLSTRSWEPIYGVDVIARAFVMASQHLMKSGGPELHLYMLGNGSLASELRRIFKKAGLQEQIHFPGQVGYDDLPRFYCSADLYVSASHSDGSSISLLEAMACGRPAIVSDIPGNREWIAPGEQGWWFRDGDSQALCEAILKAVESRAALPEMGKAARARAEQRADWSKNVQMLYKAVELAKIPGKMNG
jgi:L-malate glycosyltransferase